VIDWKKMTIRGREPARKVANVRTKSSLTIQSSPQTGRIGRISPHKIARIYKKDPRSIGVIWIRKVMPKQDIPPPTEATSTKEVPIPKEYDTDEFRELFEETEAADLADHQEWNHEIHLEEGAKVSLGKMYPVSYD
jgi:hypothetical protein